MNRNALATHYKEIRARLNRPQAAKPVEKFDLVLAPVAKPPAPEPSVVPFSRIPPVKQTGPRDVLYLAAGQGPKSSRMNGMPGCPPEARQIVLEELLRADLTWPCIQGLARFKHIVNCRHAIFIRLHFELGWSFARIGRFCGKDHTTVLHAVDKFEQSNR